MADLICVNSRFTKEVVRRTFPQLNDRHLYVLYPTINECFFDEVSPFEINEIPPIAKHIFLSLNRYERKKNIRLALEAFGLFFIKIKIFIVKGMFISYVIWLDLLWCKIQNTTVQLPSSNPSNAS